MNKWLTLGLGIFFIALITGAVLILLPPKVQAPTNTTPQSSDVVVTSPLSHSKITSPVTITGSALGTYYFEASFPIDILDEYKNVIGQGHAEAQSDWMTQDLVPFRAIVSFTSPGAGKNGFIRLKNDNPSGDPARDKFFDLPVTF